MWLLTSREYRGGDVTHDKISSLFYNKNSACLFQTYLFS